MNTLQKILQDIRFYFVIISLSLLALLANYMKIKDDYLEVVEENLYQKGTIDSLSSELFIKEIELGSYEVMWGILEEKNKKLADEINLQVE